MLGPRTPRFALTGYAWRSRAKAGACEADGPLKPGGRADPRQISFGLASRPNLPRTDLARRDRRREGRPCAFGYAKLRSFPNPLLFVQSSMSPLQHRICTNRQLCMASGGSSLIAIRGHHQGDVGSFVQFRDAAAFLVRAPLVVAEAASQSPWRAMTAYLVCRPRFRHPRSFCDDGPTRRRVRTRTGAGL